MNADTLNKCQREGWIKLAFYLLSFFYYLYGWVIIFMNYKFLQRTQFNYSLFPSLLEWSTHWFHKMLIPRWCFQTTTFSFWLNYYSWFLNVKPDDVNNICLGPNKADERIKSNLNHFFDFKSKSNWIK